MSRILVIGLAPLPFENVNKNYAPGARTWQFTQPLVDEGHEVCLVCNRTPCIYEDKISSYEKKVVNANLTIFHMESEHPENIRFLQKIHDDFNPDCIAGVNVYGSTRACQLSTDRPIWADINGYYMAEAQAKAFRYKNNKYIQRFWANELAVLNRADVFSSVSDAQKFALIGELATRGRLNCETTGYEFVHTIRSGVETREYSHDKNVIRGKDTNVDTNDFVVLWSGAYNVWADVPTLMKGLELAMKENPKVKFVSTGGSIIGHDEKTYPEMLNLVNKSPFKDRFIMRGWIPGEDVHNYYFEADIGIISEKNIYEGLLGCRTRILDWYKAGLPSLTNELCELTKIAKQHNTGMNFMIGDPEDLKGKILYLASNPDFVKKCAQNAKTYCFENHAFKKTAKPLLDWVKKPANAPDYMKKVSLEPDTAVRQYFSKSALRRIFFKFIAIPLICLIMPVLLLLYLIVIAGLTAVSLLRAFTNNKTAGEEEPETPAVKTPGKPNASLLVLNWNGKELLNKNLPSVLEAVKFDGGNHEVVVIDNGSTDGSVDFVKNRFPQVRILPLSSNKRYPGANNIAVNQCKNDIVIFLNNDMEVEKEFIAPLLNHFADSRVFAVSSKIIMPEKIKSGGIKIKETGITRSGFINGFFEVWQDDLDIKEPVPVFYFSGGSAACDRKKFLELGGFDTLYNPFYYEDTDLSFRARKKGWKILLEPESLVHHEYQGTNNSKNFRDEYVKLAMKKNYILFVWKNITGTAFTLEHFKGLFFRLIQCVPRRDVLFISAFLRAFIQLPEALFKRLTNNTTGKLSDEEVLKWM